MVKSDNFLISDDFIYIFAVHLTHLLNIFYI